MSVTKRRLRQVAAVALVAVTALGAAAACGENEPTGTKPDKLILDTFGEFGYDDLIKQYEAETGLPVTDPVRYGVERIVHRLKQAFRQPFTRSA